MTRPLLLLALPAVLLLGAATSALPPVSASAASWPAYTVRSETPRGTGAVQEVTAVLIAPAGTTPDYTRDDVVQALQQVDSYYQNETDGFIRIRTVEVSDWVEPGDTDASCTDDEAMDAFARRYAQWTPGPDKHLMALVPDEGQCGGFSDGDEPDTVDSGGVTYITNMTPAILAHELGHNLSLHHASSVRCTTGWDFDATRGLPSTCTRNEYGDQTDVMGSSYSYDAFSAPSLHRLGVISNEAVPTCGAARRIPIQTISAGSGAQRIISWSDPRRPSVQYYVQYRDAADQTEYDEVWESPDKIDRESGVQILRTDPDAAAGGSILLRPGDDGTGDALVQPGELVRLADGMSVSVASMDESAHVATVDVTVPCGTAPAGSGDPAAGAEDGTGLPETVADRTR